MIVARQAIASGLRPTARRASSPGEREVPEPLARDMTNKPIAHAAVISPRSAETHVERILTKLGPTSRTQVVAWITEKSERDRDHGEG